MYTKNNVPNKFVLPLKKKANKKGITYIWSSHSQKLDSKVIYFKIFKEQKPNGPEKFPTVL
jgi:hypothetical protein